MHCSVVSALFTLIYLHVVIRGVAGGDGELGCLCGKAHSSGCVVNGYGCLLNDAPLNSVCVCL